MRGLGAGLLALLISGPALAADLTVFAAASLTETVTALASLHEAQSGDRVTLSFAGTSILARQIDRGAPADILISANRPWIDHLEARDRIVPALRTIIAGNRLVTAVRTDDDVPVFDGGTGFIVKDQERVAIGDPTHVPVGLYARQALSMTGNWARFQPFLTPTMSTRAALALVQRRAARFAIVYRTDALAFPDIKELTVWPEASHDPIRYEAAIIRRNEGNLAAAQRFLAFLRSETAAAVLRDAGFLTCDVLDDC